MEEPHQLLTKPYQGLGSYGTTCFDGFYCLLTDTLYNRRVFVKALVDTGTKIYGGKKPHESSQRSNPR